MFRALTSARAYVCMCKRAHQQRIDETHIYVQESSSSDHLVKNGGRGSAAHGWQVASESMLFSRACKTEIVDQKRGVPFQRLWG